MNNVLVAYISRCSWRSLPILREVLGEAFKPAGLPQEVAYPDEPAATAARDRALETAHSWGPDDTVFLEGVHLAELGFEAALALARTTDAWAALSASSGDVDLMSWRLRMADASRCIAILVSIPGPSIGGAVGFVVDKYHRHAIPRFAQHVNEYVRANATIDSTVGAFSDPSRPIP